MRFFVFIYVLFSLKAIGQNKIDLQHIDFVLLEKLVLDKVNMEREVNGLNTLTNDSILCIAAQNQSDYQAKKKQMGHDQSTTKYKNVMKRVEAAGGDFSMVSENVAFGDAFGIVKLKNNRKTIELDASTYEGLADIFFIGWKQSKPHYAAIMNKQFTLTGLKFSLDSKEKRVYATQVFGVK